jgi:hypothetical protein
LPPIDVELQEWIYSVTSGNICGPPRDGYAAAVTADASVEPQKTGKIVELKLGSRPALYQSCHQGLSLTIGNRI